jgi:dTDP-4-amino-4,6-dideoxygalactose transaminase
MFGYEEGDFPVTELISSLTFAIPFFSNISLEEQNYVYQIITESLTEIKNETFV